MHYSVLVNQHYRRTGRSLLDLVYERRRKRSLQGRLRMITLRPVSVVRPFPPRFTTLAIVLMFLTIAWVVNYTVAVRSSSSTRHGIPHKFDQHLKTSGALPLAVFFFSILMRILCLTPCVGLHMALLRVAGNFKIYRAYLIIRDGPLYLSVLASLLFCYWLTAHSTREHHSSECMILWKLQAMCSVLVSTCWLALAHWHSTLVSNMISMVVNAPLETRTPRRPPNLINSLETRIYEEGWMRTLGLSECVICLGAWSPHDVIKVTPCGHAFHEECIRRWLQTSRTCAMCRQSLLSEF